MLSTDQNTRLRELANAIDGWNEQGEGARYRNELRGLVGWNRRSGPKLSQLIFEAILDDKQSNGNGKPSNSNNNNPEDIDRLIRDMYQGAAPTNLVAGIILKSGWDFTSKYLNKTAFEVQDYLDERAVDEDDSWEFLSDGSKRFFKVICTAYRSWLAQGKAR